MDSTVIIAALIGALPALGIAWFASRRNPSRAIIDVRTLTDAHGQVIRDLGDDIARLKAERDEERAEVERLEQELVDVRVEASEARAEARIARDDCARRMGRLEDALRNLGHDPATI